MCTGMSVPVCVYNRIYYIGGVRDRNTTTTQVNDLNVYYNITYAACVKRNIIHKYAGIYSQIR